MTLTLKHWIYICYYKSNIFLSIIHLSLYAQICFICYLQWIAECRLWDFHWPSFMSLSAYGTFCSTLQPPASSVQNSTTEPETMGARCTAGEATSTPWPSRKDMLCAHAPLAHFSTTYFTDSSLVLLLLIQHRRQLHAHTSFHVSAALVCWSPITKTAGLVTSHQAWHWLSFCAEVS